MLPVSYKKIEYQKGKPAGKIRVKILVIFATLVAGLFFAQLVFANNLATDGKKLSRTEEEIQKLEEENTVLKIKIAQNSSLSNLSKKAKEMGFIKPSEVLVL